MFDSLLRARRSVCALLASLSLAACGGAQNAPPGTVPAVPAAPESVAAPGIAPDTTGSVLNMLTKQAVIGSTVDPKFGQLNPYGLTVAPSTAGSMNAGDLIVCNFNAKSNVQGTGFTIVDLAPKIGSKPVLIAAHKTLVGCNALALAPGNFIWAAAFTANDNPIFGPTGKLVQNIKGKPLDRPFGQAFSPGTKGTGPAFYESNAGNGTIVRFNLKNGTTDVIASGFAVNHGMPGGIFGPSGLTYNPKGDILYIVDGTNNTVTAFSEVSKIPAGGIMVGKDCTTFSGPSAKQARLVFVGSPLNGPISAALLFNGNLVVGNTTNPNGTNLLIELSSAGKVLATRNVDTGPAGALFGIVATGTSAATTKVYFNDDNDNNLQVLEK